MHCDFAFIFSDIKVKFQAIQAFLEVSHLTVVFSAELFFVQIVFFVEKRVRYVFGYLIVGFVVDDKLV